MRLSDDLRWVRILDRHISATNIERQSLSGAIAFRRSHDTLKNCPFGLKYHSKETMDMSAMPFA